MVLYVALMVVFGVLVFTGNVDPLPAGVLGLTACVLAVCWHLLRKWNRENREKWPERVPEKFTPFRIDRTPRH
jgi:hypothetical protein